MTKWRATGRGSERLTSEDACVEISFAWVAIPLKLRQSLNGITV